MSYREIEGNLFASGAQALVNTVNCVGFMGKGVALEFRRRFPAMFDEYRRACVEGRLKPGQILPFRKSAPWVLNFAIKDDWKQPAREEWIEECLRKFRDNYRAIGLASVAFPWMGAMNGGIPLARIQALMRRHLRDLDDIDVSVYSFDPMADEPLLGVLRQRAAAMDPKAFALEAGLRPQAARTIYQFLEGTDGGCWSRLTEAPGLGEVSLAQLYSYLSHPRPEGGEARELF